MAHETKDAALTTFRGVSQRLRAAPRSDETMRIARFVAVGALNTAFGYGVFYFVLGLTGRSLVAAAVSTTLGALFNFRSTGTIVFGCADYRRLWRFLAVYVLVFCVDSLGLLALERSGVAPALAQALLLPVLASLSYILNRDFVFEARVGKEAA